MVCLVVEEMGKGWCNPLADRTNIGCRHIGKTTGELFRIHTFNILADALIFCASHVAERDEIVSDNSIEQVWVIAFTGKAFHPDAIRDQQMIEGAVH